MKKCKKCGICCKAIFVPLTKHGLKVAYNKLYQIIATEENNFRFIGLNFIKISKREAFKINPFLRTWSSYKGYFFKCKLFDNKTNLCTDYESRTSLCKDYPLPKIKEFFSPDCGYKEDNI
jgi:Fe-S-cluster containining protein